MELNKLSWFSILVNFCVHYVIVTWLQSKPMKKPSGNKESIREKKKNKHKTGQTTSKDSAYIVDLGQVCPPPSLGSWWGCQFPSPSKGQAVQGWAWIEPPWYYHVWQDRAKTRPEQSGVLECNLMLGLPRKDTETAALNSLHSPLSWGQGLISPAVQKRACCPPLPLPRIWQAQAHVPTWYLLFFLPSAHKHEHHKLPSFLNTKEWLHRKISGARTAGTHSLPPCLMSACLSLKGDTETHSPACPEGC